MANRERKNDLNQIAKRMNATGNVYKVERSCAYVIPEVCHEGN